MTTPGSAPDGHRTLDAFDSSAKEAPAPPSPGLRSKPRLLDLFCGAGGAAMGYHRAGFEVVGVDIKPMPRFPFEFHQADALEYPLDGFDVVHASPPCQAFSAYRRRKDIGKREYPNLIAATRARLTGSPCVIENVPGAPLEAPITLCGSSFRLDVRRHRCFEVRPAILAPPCDHEWQTPRFPCATNRANPRRTVEVGVWRIPLAVQQKAMGIDWMRLEELSEAIPPAYTEYIGKQLMAALRR
jgi:DNA (cytosine-5)-methyltransferase 1